MSAPVDVFPAYAEALRAALGIIDPMLHIGRQPTRDQLTEARSVIEKAMLDSGVTELIEMLKYCESWFAKHSPTAELINGGVAEHPILTSIRGALARVGGAA